MKNILMWLISITLTFIIIYYQRATGPSYPLKGNIRKDSLDASYSFKRSHALPSDQPVTVTVNKSTKKLEGNLFYRRFKSNDPWTPKEMELKDDELKATLPAQPKAGKLEYFVTISHEGYMLRLPENNNVVTRFRGYVPSFILIPHILFIFLAFLFSNKTALDAIYNKVTGSMIIYTLIAFILGGLLLGPIVQYYAFDAFWTGFPLGKDLTDTKTLIAIVAWIFPLLNIKRRKLTRLSTILAGIITIAVYFIPHSMMGSEYDYTKEKITTAS